MDSQSTNPTAPAPRSASFTDLEFSYPLKLIVPDRKFMPGKSVECVYVLSYGGGLVAGDKCSLDVTVDGQSTLVMLTQVTCFTKSNYSQRQTFELEDETSSLILLDWYTSGRSLTDSNQLGLKSSEATLFGRQDKDDPEGERQAKESEGVVGSAAEGGETWSFTRYRSHNEVRTSLDVRKPLAKDVLLLIDDEPNKPNFVSTSHRESTMTSYSTRVNPYSCYASIIIFGPAFDRLVQTLTNEFDKVTQYKQNLPFSLLWSFSRLHYSVRVVVDGREQSNLIRGGIVRCCGASTEQVKEWIVDMLTKGGIEDVVGRDLWKVALT
ncbi:hypothetical protein OIV83_000397 [Microbotryomycetes sp. JL201]|nr:hypothetical protein OIV83_000397 [Microbotryomycetes sp. JL201]